jgi:hypothetical protein
VCQFVKISVLAGNLNNNQVTRKTIYTDGEKEKYGRATEKRIEDRSRVDKGGYNGRGTIIGRR